MKKIFALLLVVCTMFMSGIAFAEEIDLSAMTEEELWTLIANARMELGKYNPAIAEGEVFFEDENIRITINSEPYIEHENLRIDVIIENFSDKNINISFDNCKINGWDVSGSSLSVTADGKAKDSLNFYDVVELAELSDAAELQDINGVIEYYDSDTYDTIYESETLNWMFGE